MVFLKFVVAPELDLGRSKCRVLQLRPNTKHREEKTLPNLVTGKNFCLIEDTIFGEGLAKIPGNIIKPLKFAGH